MTEDIIDLNQLSINRLDHGKTIPSPARRSLP